MAETTNDDTQNDSGSGGITDSLMAFLKEPLGIGLAAGMAIALVLGYMIL